MSLAVWAVSDIRLIGFLQEKQRRLIGGPSSGKMVYISEKNRHQTQVCSLFMASWHWFFYSKVWHYNVKIVSMLLITVTLSRFFWCLPQLIPRRLPIKTVLVVKVLFFQAWCHPKEACPGGAVSSVAVRAAWLVATVIGESGFEAQAGPIIVSGYSDVCFKIKFSGRHRGFDGVLFNLWPLSNTGFRDAQY